MNKLPMQFLIDVIHLIRISPNLLCQISYLVMFAYISLTLGDSPRLSSFYISSKVCSNLWFQFLVTQ